MTHNLKATFLISLCFFGATFQASAAPAATLLQESKTFAFKTQYPGNRTREEPPVNARFPLNEKKQEDDIKKLYIKTLPYITNRTKRSRCIIFMCSPNIASRVDSTNFHNSSIFNKDFKALCNYIFIQNRDKITLESCMVVEVDRTRNFMELSKIQHNNALPSCTLYCAQYKLMLNISKRLSHLESLPAKLQTANEVLNPENPPAEELKPENATSQRNSELQFLDVPRGKSRNIEKLQLDEEYFVFGGFSRLIGYLQPRAFPLDILKEALQHHVPIHLLGVQIFEMEALSVGWVLLWALLALFFPCVVAAKLCCAENIRQRLREDSSDSSLDFNKWSRRILGFSLHVLLLMLLGCTALMLGSNEQLSRTVAKSSNSAELIFQDMETFVQDTEMQISFVAASSMELALDAIYRHLEDVENLLGKPIQHEVDDETGVITALNLLQNLKKAKTELALRVSELRKNCVSARKWSILFEEFLLELAKILELSTQQCDPEDRPLCDILQSTNLNASLYINRLPSEQDLKMLEDLGQTEEFNRCLREARQTFESLPRQISQETAIHRADIKRFLSLHRGHLHKSILTLAHLSKSLTEKLTSTKRDVTDVVQSVATWDIWRWLLVLGLSSLIFVVWGLLMCGAPCGCSPAASTTPIFLTGLGLACLLAPIVWAFGTVAYLTGSHAQAFLCEPLYDEPQYTILGDILNDGGVLYKNEGFLNKLFDGNYSLRVGEVLRNCQSNHTAYVTFNLHRILDLNTVTNYNSWDDLKVPFENFSIDLNKFEILSSELRFNLLLLTKSSAVNLKNYRIREFGSVTTRDLNSFVDQVERIGKQLSNRQAALTMENLSYRVRQAIINYEQPLKQTQNIIFYEMTAIEVMLEPLNKQVYQVLSHLKTIQHFIDNEGRHIAEKHSKEYISTLEHFLSQLDHHVWKQIHNTIAKCQPLWESYDAARRITCNLLVDPMNAFSIACYLCILIFIGLAPILIQLIETFRDDEVELCRSNTHRRARNGLLIDEECTWATPSPPENSLQPTTPPESSLWTVSRQALETLIPAPPSLPQSAPSTLPRFNQPPRPQTPRPGDTPPQQSTQPESTSWLASRQPLETLIPAPPRISGDVT